VDNLVRMVLIAIALTVLLGVIFFCMPGRTGLMSDLRGILHRARMELSAAPARATQALTRSAQSEIMRVSYNDPRIRSTLHLPWAR